jgi:hypothetical protein
VDKKKNAEGLRAPRTFAPSSPLPLSPAGMAPLLPKIIQQYAATGLPPAIVSAIGRQGTAPCFYDARAGTVCRRMNH